jgi:hypothetical protein
MHEQLYTNLTGTKQAYISVKLDAIYYVIVNIYGQTTKPKYAM